MGRIFSQLKGGNCLLKNINHSKQMVVAYFLICNQKKGFQEFIHFKCLNDGIAALTNKKNKDSIVS